MTTPYLSPDEYATYGVPGIADSLILQASALIDTHCHRQILAAQYEDQFKLPENRNQFNVPIRPLLEVVSAEGRYGYPRRGAAWTQQFPATTIAQLSTFFGGPPIWEDIDVSLAVINGPTGEIWIPAGIYMVHYTEIHLVYRAGYNAVPDEIKQACALLATALDNQEVGVKTFKAGDRSMSAWSSSAITSDVRALLAPFVAKTLR